MCISGYATFTSPISAKTWVAMSRNSGQHEAKFWLAFGPEKASEQLEKHLNRRFKRRFVPLRNRCYSLASTSLNNT
jgi:hypothetical protein